MKKNKNDISSDKQIKISKRKKYRKKLYAELKKKFKCDPYGFDRKNEGIIPRVEIFVHGDGASIAEAFRKENVSIEDLSEKHGDIRFKIRKKDLRKAIAICERMCYNVTVGKTFGIGASVRYWRARIGLAIGSAAAAVLLCTSYSYILHIEISGNESVPTATIERVLSDNGITFGVKKKCIDLSEAAAAAGNTPGISDASCEIKGTTLYVRVLESPDETEVKRFPSMVSAYDAKVTRIVVRNGTSLVKRGDVVKVGDFVADGRVYSTAGELLYTGDCDADVYGNVSLVFTKILGTTSVEYRETGKAEKKTGFKLFGFDIFDTSSSFVSYESRAATANYDVLLPLYVTTIYYRETEAVTTERNIDDVAMEYMKRVAEDMSFAGDFQSSYTVKPAESGLYSVSVFLSGETLISRGSEKPLQIENEPADV